MFEFALAAWHCQIKNGLADDLGGFVPFARLTASALPFLRGFPSKRDTLRPIDSDGGSKAWAASFPLTVSRQLCAA
ncbi:MAG: hypothetical protein O9322_13665 [Beijerinckiaceae bacterium]|nr:hypothetical protein [Beijerinckiaceae bacterium]MCZ8300394.1 hypothetical protein [Beijerinckiaceae bacterium]